MDISKRLINYQTDIEFINVDTQIQSWRAIAYFTECITILTEIAMMITKCVKFRYESAACRPKTHVRRAVSLNSLNETKLKWNPGDLVLCFAQRSSNLWLRSLRGPSHPVLSQSIYTAIVSTELQSRRSERPVCQLVARSLTSVVLLLLVVCFI